LLHLGRREADLSAEREARREEVEQLRLQLETIRYRASQLRAELSAADSQARLSHQLTTLGRFTAGFLHEFNNPLAILTNRIEILLEERKDDVALCADLEQMLKEARYMGRIAGTLLPALRRERGEKVFEASDPAEILQDALAAMGPSAEREGVRIVLETSDVPPVNLPGHVASEVVRGLLANALAATSGREDGTIWLRIEPYRTAGSRVVLRVDDNGPGVPENIRDHLFEPFISQSPGRERLGLGLFLAASLLDTYDGSLRYETRNGGGASFVVEMPPARFTRGQPYHWFVKGVVS
jgi:signal transduction histidine kinase